MSGFNTPPDITTFVTPTEHPCTLLEKSSFAYQVDVQTLAPKIPSHPTSCVTIAYPGMFGTEAQFSKYVDGAIKTSTNEIAECKRALALWSCVFAGSPLPEIRPLPDTERLLVSWKPQAISKALLKLSFNKLTASIARIRFWQQAVHITKAPHKKDTYSLNGYYINPRLFNLGQERDIAQHKKRVAEAESIYGSAPKILTGISRGAFTTCTAVVHNTYTNVRLVMLEGCGDTLANVIDNSFWWVQTKRMRQFLYKKITAIFTEYKLDGISPAQVAEQFPHHIPVAFISSRRDSVVPYTTTKNLVEKFKAAGHPQIYFLTLEHSSHAGYMMDNAQDREKYQLFTKALYHTLDIQPELATFDSPEQKEKAMKILRESRVSL